MTPAAKPSAARKLYILIEGDGSRCVYASSRAGAIQRAQEWITSTVLGDHDPDGAEWYDVSIRCPADGWEEIVHVQVDQPEPACLKSRRPHSWGPARVSGHGAGVIETDCCGACGVRRTTDTWAQRPDTGEQGFTVVSYEAASAS